MRPTVVVTRAEETSGELSERLVRSGLSVIHFPTIRIACQPLSSSPEAFDWVVFTSANAVRCALEPGVRLSRGVRIAAIGESTEKALVERGYTVALRPPQATGQSLIDTLANLNLDGRSLFVPTSSRADVARWDRLRTLGASVTVEVAYTTECEREHPPERLRSLTAADMALFASPSAFHCFREATEPEILNQLEIGVIGPTTRKAIENAGFRVAVMPVKPTMEALAAAVASYFNAH